MLFSFSCLTLHVNPTKLMSLDEILKMVSENWSQKTQPFSTWSLEMCVVFSIDSYWLIHTSIIYVQYCVKPLYCMGTLTRHSGIHYTDLNCEIGGLDCRVITTEYRTWVHVIYSWVSSQCSHAMYGRVHCSLQVFRQDVAYHFLWNCFLSHLYQDDFIHFCTFTCR